MCCLRYERDFYTKALEKYPKIGTTIKTDKGTGTMKKFDVFKESITIEYENMEEEDITLADYKKLNEKKKEKKKKPKKKPKKEKTAKDPKRENIQKNSGH